MRESSKSTSLDLVQTLFPLSSKYGLLIDLETCFDVSTVRAISPRPQMPSNLNQSSAKSAKKKNLVVGSSSAFMNSETRNGSSSKIDDEDTSLSVNSSAQKKSGLKMNKSESRALSKQ